MWPSARYSLPRLIVPILLLPTLIAMGGVAQEDRSAWGDQDERLTQAQLRRDFGILRESLEEGHAGLYRYRTKEEMDARFSAVEAEFDRPMEHHTFVRHIAALISYIGDGHTGWREDADHARATRDRAILPPYVFHFHYSRVYIRTDLREGTADLAGAEVVAINGESPLPIVERLCGLLPGDGRVMTGRRRRLRDPATFGTLYALEYGPCEEWSLTVRVPGETQDREVRSGGFTTFDLLQARNRVGRTSSPPAGAFRIEEGIGILTIGTFGGQRYGEREESFDTFLRSAFRELTENGVGNLILDMRDNGGGRDEYGRFLVSHLLDEPFLYYDRLEMRSDSFDFLKYTGMAGRAGERIAAVERDEEGRWVRTDHPNLGIQQPREPHFGGRVFTLVNGGSFSATGEVASVLRAHNRAVFIGEETGAGRTGNSSGIMVGLTLPESGLTVNIPMVGYYMPIEPGPHPDRGIIPDYEVVPAVEDLMNGRDIVMERAIQLAKGGANARYHQP